MSFFKWLKTRTAVTLDAGLQVADAIIEQLAHRSATGKTGSMNPTCWKTKNLGKVSY